VDRRTVDVAPHDGATDVHGRGVGQGVHAEERLTMGAPQEEERQYGPGETITEQPRPRVLLLDVDDATLASRLADKIPTLAAVDHLGGIDLHE
jgi:hypothetical protein